MALCSGEWTRSSRSTMEGGNCVEAVATPRRVMMRDSRHPALGRLAFPPAEWLAFLHAVRREPR